MVTIDQVHSHSKSCRKYNNSRYNFGKFSSNRTIVAVLLPDRMSDDEKNIILQKRETKLSTAEEYINEKLDPMKANILNQRKAPSMTDIFCELGIIENEYYKL